MSKKQVISIIGEPDYSGGYVASILPGRPYTSHYSRYILFFVYPDKSLVVFRKDTVVEIKRESDSFFRRLRQFSKRQKHLKNSAF